MACEHQNQHFDANTVFLEDAQRYLLELRMLCTDCGQPFGFRGLPCGVSIAGGAMVDPSAQELRVVLYSPSELALAPDLPGLTDQTDTERLQDAVDTAVSTLHATAYVGGPAIDVAHRQILRALEPLATQHQGQGPT